MEVDAGAVEPAARLQLVLQTPSSVRARAVVRSRPPVRCRSRDPFLGERITRIWRDRGYSDFCNAVTPRVPVLVSQRPCYAVIPQPAEPGRATRYRFIRERGQRYALVKHDAAAANTTVVSRKKATTRKANSTP